MNDVYFYVVTEDTLDEFKKRFAKDNGDLLFYALSVRDYETIALNIGKAKQGSTVNPIQFTKKTD